MTYQNGVAAIRADLALGWGLGILAICMGYFIAWCKLFKKAGLPWERMFVPFYGAYWMHKLAECAWMFWVWPAAMIVSTVLMEAVDYHGTIVTLVYSVQLLGFLVLHCVYCVKLAKAYGKGGGFAVGLILLHHIFIMILGFGSASYAQLDERQEAFWDAWKCNACGTVNKADRTHCRECGGEK